MTEAKIIDAIEGHLTHLDPPVLRFERLIGRQPFRVLIAVLLSSRTRDTTTIPAVKRLFSRADNPREMDRLSQSEIAACIYPVGFYRQKARHIKQILKFLREHPDIPPERSDLLKLPGVGVKTANLVLSLAFQIPSIAVDTHVFRISRRLGFSNGTRPREVQEDLEARFESRDWNRINRIMVGFGQTLCTPRHPRCDQCPVSSSCRYPESHRIQKG